MKQPAHTTVGIIGGIGPAATAYCFQRLIELCQDLHGAVQDDDFPTVLVTSLALETANEKGALTSLTEAQNYFKKHSELISINKTDYLYVACNTMHLFLEEAPVVGRKVVDLVQSCAHFLAKNNIKKAVVFCSETAREQHLYENVLEGRGVKTVSVSSSDQQKVTECIRAGMSGDLAEGRRTLITLCQKYAEKADAIVLGCTELSLIVDQKHERKGKVVDPQEVVLRKILKGVYDAV